MEGCPEGLKPTDTAPALPADQGRFGASSKCVWSVAELPAVLNTVWEMFGPTDLASSHGFRGTIFLVH